MHNITVQQPLSTVSLNSNPTIVGLQSEAGFVSNYSAIPFCCPCPPFISPLVVQTPVVPIKGKRSNGRLVDIPLCWKRRRMERVDTE
ncbi:hypothetical protein TNCV_2107831 [Trichonephila clavipes]|nr:hypothetical protein TNCV_2107831 [Trichonephila clavipes]